MSIRAIALFAFLFIAVGVTGYLEAADRNAELRIRKQLFTELSEMFPNNSQFCVNDATRALMGEAPQHEWCTKAVDRMLEFRLTRANW